MKSTPAHAKAELLRERLDGLAELATLTVSQAQLDQINREAEKITRELEEQTKTKGAGR